MLKKKLIKSKQLFDTPNRNNIDWIFFFFFQVAIHIQVLRLMRNLLIY